MTIEQPIIDVEAETDPEPTQDERRTRRSSPAQRADEPAAERDASYLPEETSTQASERWLRIQSEFVNDPRQSVAQAHALVSDLMQRIVSSFTDERDQLERQWSQGDSVSTEDLRMCLQRYRSFFSRLLPLEPGSRSAH